MLDISIHLPDIISWYTSWHIQFSRRAVTFDYNCLIYYSFFFAICFELMIDKLTDMFRNELFGHRVAWRCDSLLWNHNGLLLPIKADVQFKRELNASKDLVRITQLSLSDKWTGNAPTCRVYTLLVATVRTETCTGIVDEGPNFDQIVVN